MYSEERRETILKILAENGRVSVKDLADRFNLSVDSIRRDLSILEDKKLLQRTHGGAIPISKVRTPASPPSIRYGNGGPQENAISKVAASYIQERDTIFISGAGIHYGMLKYLPSYSFTVVTNSLKIADTLKEKDNIEIYLIGGKIKPSGEITDVLAHQFIQQFTIDICFLTGGGISANGISLGTPETANFIREVSKASKRKICLAPHYKVGMDFFVKSIPIEENDLLITDEETAREEIKKIEERGVKVIVAKEE